MATSLRPPLSLPDSVLLLLARGTNLRDGIDRIVANRHGALIVPNDTPGVRAICENPTELDDQPLTAAALAEAATAEGAIILDNDLTTIVAHQAHLKPRSVSSGGHVGTKHKTADEMAQMFPGLPILAISETRRTISVFWWDGLSTRRMPDQTSRAARRGWGVDLGRVDAGGPVGTRDRAVPDVTIWELPDWQTLTLQFQIDMQAFDERGRQSRKYYRRFTKHARAGQVTPSDAASAVRSAELTLRLRDQIRRSLLLLGPDQKLAEVHVAANANEIHRRLETLIEVLDAPGQDNETSRRLLNEIPDDALIDDGVILTALGWSCDPNSEVFVDRMSLHLAVDDVVRGLRPERSPSSELGIAQQMAQ